MDKYLPPPPSPTQRTTESTTLYGFMGKYFPDVRNEIHTVVLTFVSNGHFAISSRRTLMTCLEKIGLKYRTQSSKDNNFASDLFILCL